MTVFPRLNDSIPRYVRFPFAFMARSVQDAKYDNGVGPEHEENAIWETPGKHPAHFGTATQSPIFVGIRRSALDRRANFRDEFFPQSGPLGLETISKPNDPAMGRKRPDGEAEGRSVSE